MTIDEFITARLDESEQSARAVPAYDPRFGFGETFVSHDGEYTQADRAFVDRHDPARVLLEVEALRAVLAEHPSYDGRGESCWTCADTAEDLTPWPCPTVRAVASIWAGHPDYRQEWKP